MRLEIARQRADWQRSLLLHHAVDLRSHLLRNDGRCHLILSSIAAILATAETIDFFVGKAHSTCIWIDKVAKSLRIQYCVVIRNRDRLGIDGIFRLGALSLSNLWRFSSLIDRSCNALLCLLTVSLLLLIFFLLQLDLLYNLISQTSIAHDFAYFCRGKLSCLLDLRLGLRERLGRDLELILRLWYFKLVVDVFQLVHILWDVSHDFPDECLDHEFARCRIE